MTVFSGKMGQNVDIATNETLEAPMPALISATQALGEPRYPILKGIMAARRKEVITRSLADLDLRGVAVGGAVATSRVTGARPRAARGTPRVVQTSAVEAAGEIVSFLAERRLI